GAAGHRVVRLVELAGTRRPTGTCHSVGTGHPADSADRAAAWAGADSASSAACPASWSSDGRSTSASVNRDSESRGRRRGCTQPRRLLVTGQLVWARGAVGPPAVVTRRCGGRVMCQFGFVGTTGWLAANRPVLHQARPALAGGGPARRGA